MNTGRSRSDSPRARSIGGPSVPSPRAARPRSNRQALARLIADALQEIPLHVDRVGERLDHRPVHASWLASGLRRRTFDERERVVVGPAVYATDHSARTSFRRGDKLWVEPVAQRVAQKLNANTAMKMAMPGPMLIHHIRLSEALVVVDVLAPRCRRRLRQTEERRYGFLQDRERGREVTCTIRTLAILGSMCDRDARGRYTNCARGQVSRVRAAPAPGRA